MVVNRFTLITMFAFIINACSSSNIRMVSSNEFKKEYKNSKIFHTTKSYTLLNVKKGKICLEKKEMSSFNKNKWNKELICIQIDLLDKDMKEDILNSLNKK